MTVEWLNDQNISINYIILSQENSLYIDNLNLTANCIGLVDPNFEYEIDCQNLTVEFIPYNQNPDVIHLWDFGDGKH